MTVGVIAALGEELAALRRRVIVESRARVGRCRIVRGRLGGRLVVLAWTGSGPSEAAAGARAILEGGDVDRLLVVGFSGGLSPELDAGALVVAREILDDGASAAAPDVAWATTIAGLAGLREARLVASRSILGTSRAKRDAWDALPRGLPAVVDLESAAIVREAASRGVPFAVIRAVSDAAGESLPLDFNRCLDRTGRLRRSRVVGLAALAPQRLPALWRLGRRAARCADGLAEAAVGAIEGVTR